MSAPDVRPPPTAPRSGPPPAPFARVPDPRAYVARPACEEALAGLLRALDEGARVAVLEGPTGIGKSLLLRVLEARLDPRYELVRLPLAGSSFDELAAIALSGLDERSPARVALTLEEAARRLRVVGKVLVVAVDDAARLPADAADGLARALRAGRGALGAVLAVATGAPRPRLAGGARTVRLAAPMSADETSRYVEARLARAADPRLARCFGANLVAELHARSGGVPAALHILAEGVLDEARSRGLLDDGEDRTAAPGLGPPVGGYLARGETERVLGALASELRSGRRCQLLRGSAGLGKTTVLRELGARLREPFQPVDVYYAKLDPPDFFAWVLHQIGAPSSQLAPELELRQIAQRLARVGGTLVLLVDEAQSLPRETLARLVECVAASEGALRVVAALDLAEDPQPLRALPDLLEHRLAQPLDVAECATYLDWRLDTVLVGLRTQLGPYTARELHRASGGNPRVLARLASEVERTALERFAKDEAGGREREGLTAADPRPAPSSHAAPIADGAPASGRVGSASSPGPFGSQDARVPLAAATADVSAAELFPASRLALVAPLALGAGVPLALFSLWLWLAPLFTAPEAGARLAIAAPPGTALAVDGRYVGEAPLEGVELDPGVHAVRAVLPDGSLVERRVVVWPQGASVRLP